MATHPQSWTSWEQVAFSTVCLTRRYLSAVNSANHPNEIVQSPVQNHQTKIRRSQETEIDFLKLNSQSTYYTLLYYVTTVMKHFLVRNCCQAPSGSEHPQCAGSLDEALTRREGPMGPVGPMD